MNKWIVLILLYLVLILNACSSDMNAEELNREEIAPTLAAISPTEPPEPTPEPTPIPTEPSPPYTITPDIKYRGGSTGKLNLFQPEEDLDKGVTILMFHPGRGRPSDLYQAALFFVERGYQVVTVGFRDWPKYQYPVPVEDVFCAVAWMAANAGEYNFHVDQLVTYGHSFGATMAASLAVVEQPDLYLSECDMSWSEEINFIAAVSFTGIFDYEETVAISPGMVDYVNDYLGSSLEDAAETWEQASPSSWVDGSEPPFMVIHGVVDNIPVGNAELFVSLLEGAGVPVTVSWSDDLIHQELLPSKEYMAEVELFLEGILQAE